MKKLLNTVLIIFFALASTRVSAVVLDKEFLKEKIKESVERQIKTNTSIKGRVEVQEVNFPYEKIEINGENNKNIQVKTTINLKYLNPTTLVRVSIFTDNKIQKSFVSQVKINVYEKVWVAKDCIKRGESLSNTAFEEKEITYSLRTIKDEHFDLYKYVAKKNYGAGEALDSGFIEPTPDIVKDSPVAVIFKSSTVSVTVMGIALSNGNVGDYIKVRSKDFKRDYQGKIINECQVLVNI